MAHSRLGGTRTNAVHGKRVMVGGTRRETTVDSVKYRLRSKSKRGIALGWREDHSRALGDAIEKEWTHDSKGDGAGRSW